MKRDEVITRIEHAARAGNQNAAWQLYVSHPISLEMYHAAYRRGARLAELGGPCSCPSCSPIKTITIRSRRLRAL